jgi:hypothetical protein
MQDTLECYKVLEVPPGSPAKTVRKAYVSLCQVWHPDRFIDNPPLRNKAAERMAQIQSAYDTLKQYLPELENPDHGKRPPDDISGLVIDRPEPEATGRSSLVYTILALLLLASIILGTVGYLVYLRHTAAGGTFS